MPVTMWLRKNIVWSKASSYILLTNILLTSNSYCLMVIWSPLTCQTCLGTTPRWETLFLCFNFNHLRSTSFWDISRFLLFVVGRFWWCTHQLLVYGLPNYRTSWYPPAHACTNYRAGHFLSIPSIFPAPHTSCCDQLHTVPLDCYAWNKMLFYKVTMLLLGCLLIFAPDYDYLARFILMVAKSSLKYTVEWCLSKLCLKRMFWSLEHIF